MIGLTGGIASGKSTVSAEFAALGAAIVDTDIIAREIVAPGSEALAEIVDVFGASMIADDGRLDRRQLRARVFSEAAARQRLEAILHPRIRDAARTGVEQARGPYVVLVVPLLVESGEYDWVDRIVVVDIDHALQERLLMARDDLQPDLARAMIAAQASRARRLGVADDVIRNSGTLNDLRVQTQIANRRYRKILPNIRDSQPPF